jgi:hypothetical protein
MVPHQLGHKAVDGASGSSEALENIRAIASRMAAENYKGM